MMYGEIGLSETHKWFQAPSHRMHLHWTVSGLALFGKWTRVVLHIIYFSTMVKNVGFSTCFKCERKSPFPMREVNVRGGWGHLGKTYNVFGIEVIFVDCSYKLLFLQFPRDSEIRKIVKL